MKIIKTCKTCEFRNDKGICTSGGIYKYGEKTTDDDVTCYGWSPDLDYFLELQKDAPWFIKDKYEWCKISFGEFLDLMEKYYNNEPIEVNIYSLIGVIYKFTFWELSEILNVSTGVLRYAMTRGTIYRRKVEFSNKLQIPIKYFDKVTTLDFPEIEILKDDFYRTHKDMIEIAKKKAAELQLQGISESEYQSRIRTNENLLSEFATASPIFHDLTNDYKTRDFIVEIALQDGDYYGSIYYACNSAYSFGLDPDTMQDIFEFVNSLTCENINDLNEEALLLNNINLVSEDEKNISFELKNNNGDTLKKIVPSEKLQNFITTYRIIKYEGHGRKKEERKCISCKNFKQHKGSAKGLCSVKNQDVQRSRIICAFDYVPNE